VTPLDETTKTRVLVENKRYYNSEYADMYDEVHPLQHNHYAQRIMRRELRHIFKTLNRRPIRLLDVASGTGNLSLNAFTCQPNGLEVTAVDISSRMLDHLLHKASKIGVRKNITVIESDIETFFLTNKNSFDVVGMASALHHIPNYWDILSPCLNTISPGGYFYVHQEPLMKDGLSNMARIFSNIDTRAYFCFHVFKKDGLPFPIRALKFLKSIFSPALQKIKFLDRLRERLSTSPQMARLYCDGLYSDENLKYVEFHDAGVDHKIICQKLQDNGFSIFLLSNAPDKHYRVFYELSRLFRSPSHFTIIAKKS
jgi:ubiquinone/menaquinone biosynthesis C-methylase UbiE